MTQPVEYYDLGIPGPPGPPPVVLPNVAAIGTFSDLSLPDGTQVFVQSPPSYYVIDHENADAIVPFVTLALLSSVGGSLPGRARRLSMAHPKNTSQPFWYIDPQNASTTASDANDGLTSGTAILTAEELARRVRRWDDLNFALDVFFLSPRNPTDPTWTPRGSCTQNGSVTVHGVPRGTSSTVIKSGTLSGWRPRKTVRQTIVSSTNASPSVATESPAHGYMTGELIQIQDHTGNTALNANAWQIVVLSPTTYALYRYTDTGPGDPSLSNGVGAGGTSISQEPNKVTDSTGAAWPYDGGFYVLLTSGANAGAFAPIVVDLGGGMCAVGEFTAPNGITIVQPSGTETYQVVRPTDLYSFAWGIGGPSNGGTFSSCKLVDASINDGPYASGGLYQTLGDASSGLTMTACVVGGFPTSLGQHQRNNCIWRGGESCEGSMFVVAGLFQGIGVGNTGGLQVGGGGSVYYFSNPLIHSGQNAVLPGGIAYAFGLGLYMCQGQWFTIFPGGSFSLKGSTRLWGSSLGAVLRLLAGGKFRYGTAAVFDTSHVFNGTDIWLEYNTPNAAPVRGDAPLTLTWANILAPYVGSPTPTGFGGSFIDWQTGASVCFATFA